MKEIEIKVTRKKIYAEIGVATAFLGGKSAPSAPDPALHFDTLVTVDEDNGVLSQFIDDAVTTLAESLGRRVTAMNLSGETVKVSILVADSYDEKQTPVTESIFRKYLTAKVMGDWLSATLPQAADVWKEKAAEALSAMASATTCVTLLRRVPAI